MHNTTAQLKGAIERLPLSRPLNSDQLDGAAQALEMGAYFAMVNQLPRMQSSRQRNGMVKELQQFSRLAGRLCRHIGLMHREAIGAVSPKGERHVLALQDDLRARIAKAAKAIERAPAVEARPSNHRLGPKQVAEVCGQMFTDLTGKRPTLHYDDAAGKRTGPFLRFVKDVFMAFRIDASAEHYARDAEAAGDVVGGNGGITIRRVPH